MTDEGEMEKIVPSALNAGSDTGALVQVTFQKNPYQTQKYLEGDPKALGITEIMLSLFFLSTIVVDWKYHEGHALVIISAIFSLANIIAGSVAIAAQNLHLPTLKACLGMQVVACVLSGVSFIINSELMVLHSSFHYCWDIPHNDTLRENMCERQWTIHDRIIGIEMLVLLTQIALSATLAAFCCKVIQCCSPRNNVVALTFAEEDARLAKPIASMLPPVPFGSTATTPTSTTPTNITTLPPTTPITTTNATTHPPTTANATTHSVTTAPPTTPNMTTASPNTTTPPNVTTASPPTPGPTPPTNITVGNYTMKDGNKLCVMVQAAIQIRVNNSQMEGTYNVPGGEHPIDRKCDNNTAILKIDVKEGSISLTFFKNDTSNVVFVRDVAVNLTYAFKPGVSHSLLKKNESVQLFSMAISHSYSCKSESFFMGDGVFLGFHHERMQAFNFTNNQFGTLDLCKADQPDYRVAIGVGVVLLILIIIVVVAYLISRRRRTDGYQAL